jgi:hypothetical protein
MLELPGSAQHAVHRALGSEERAFVGERRHDLLRREIAEARRVDDLEDQLPFGRGQLVRWLGCRTSTLVLADVLLAPSLQRALVEAELLAGDLLTCPGLDGFVDKPEDQVSFFG